MIPKYPSFKNIEISDINSVLSYLENYPANICELNLANIIMWKDFDHAELTLINDNFCIRINPLNEPPYFLEPLGKNKINETVDICLENAKMISRASEKLASSLNKEKYKISELRRQFDYIYKTSELSELKGKKYDGKRNQIKRFLRLHPEYKYVPLTPEMKNESIALFEKWFAARQESKYFPRLAHTAQKNALENAFAYFNKIKLIGGAITDRNSLLGFMIGSRLNKNTACAHFQYYDPTLQGITQALTRDACVKTFSQFEYMNLEQDLGIPGLRQAKLSYHLLKLEKKFEISLNLLTIKQGSGKHLI